MIICSNRWMKMYGSNCMYRSRRREQRMSVTQREGVTGGPTNQMRHALKKRSGMYKNELTTIIVIFYQSVHLLYCYTACTAIKSSLSVLSSPATLRHDPWLLTLQLIFVFGKRIVLPSLSSSRQNDITIIV